MTPDGSAATLRADCLVGQAAAGLNNDGRSNYHPSVKAASSVVEGFAVIVGSVLGTALAVVAIFEVVAGLGRMWVRGLAVIVLAGLGVAMASTKFRHGRTLGFPASGTSEEGASLGTGPRGAPTDHELEDAITRALDELPRAFRDQISNLGIVIEDEPPDGKPWLATYQGTPLTKRSNQLSWMWPSKIDLPRTFEAALWARRNPI